MRKQIHADFNERLLDRPMSEDECVAYVKSLPTNQHDQMWKFQSIRKLAEQLREKSHEEIRDLEERLAKIRKAVQVG